MLISFRIPWIPKATPDVYPHIAHCDGPLNIRKGYVVESLPKQEDLLRNVYKTPTVTLGYCCRTPMACQKMYEVGFKEYKRTQLPGKVHAIFFKKTLCYQIHCILQRVLERAEIKGVASKDATSFCTQFLYTIILQQL